MRLSFFVVDKLLITFGVFHFNKDGNYQNKTTFSHTANEEKTLPRPSADIEFCIKGSFALSTFQNYQLEENFH